jgi:hypothetical protein
MPERLVRYDEGLLERQINRLKMGAQAPEILRGQC